MQISFLYVSRLSFLTGSSKGKEGFVKKRHGDFRAGGGCRSVVRALLFSSSDSDSDSDCNVSSWRLCWRWPLTCCAQLPTQWGRRWLVVQDTALTYLNPETGQTSHHPQLSSWSPQSSLTPIMVKYLARFYGESDVTKRFLHHFYFRHDEAVMSFSVY